MRLLLDECVPRKFLRGLVGHDARTVRQMGWSGKRNGELLSLMLSNGFEAFVTVDQNVRYQQNISAAGVAVVVLVAATNKLVDLIPLLPDALAAIATIKPGEIVEVTDSSP